MLSIEAEGKHVYGKDIRRKKFPIKVWISTSYLTNFIWLARIHSMCQGICFHLFIAGYGVYFSCNYVLKGVRNKNNNGYEILDPVFMM